MIIRVGKFLAFVSFGFLLIMGIVISLPLDSQVSIQNFGEAWNVYTPNSEGIVEKLKPVVSMIINGYEGFVVYYLIFGNSFHLMILCFGFINSRKRYLIRKLDMSKRLVPLRSLTPISILMPAYNEESTVIDSVKSMLNLNYPEFEIILCNDGSKDRTLELLISELELSKVHQSVPQVLPSNSILGVYKSKKYPNITVLDKKNGGKSDALNAAINHSKYPLICCVDCDSLLDHEGLTRVAIPFFEDPVKTIAVGGVIRIANDATIEYGRVIETRIPFRWISMIQIVEYLRAFLVGRMGWDFIDCNTIISGAFGLFKKSTVIAVGGYDPKTVGEDFELLLRMHVYACKHKQDYKVSFLPDPVCWTEAPVDLKTLGNQRSRWQQGLGESLWKSKSILFKPWGGRIGWIALPYLWLFELIAAPLELLGCLVLVLSLPFGLLSTELALLFLLSSVVYGITLSLGAVLVEELTFQRYPRISDFLKLILGAILEQFGFRQLHLYWRSRGMWRWLTGNQKWGDMKRVGFKVKK